MTTFIQLHFLTAYPSSNLNRDDAGRPKTAIVGGVERLRVSSQSLKRAWRTSEVFESAMDGHIGTRSRRIGRDIYTALIAGGMSEKLADEAAKSIAKQFGKQKDAKGSTDPLEQYDIEQLAHFSVQERALIDQLVACLIAESRKPNSEELNLLRKDAASVDIALFGRMLAAEPEFNVEAACQVAHALGVSAVTIEDDFFTAVDDLNTSADSGSAHMGEQSFASALFYHYVCINRDLLLENLNNDEELVARTLRALTETALTVSPGGKQNSFASRALATYALAEKGSDQPRTLSVAFFKPIRNDDQVNNAIELLRKQKTKFDRVYASAGSVPSYELNVEAESEGGSLQGLLDFISQ
ncbi:type I-E CRISPR-associated protein Cas7/Cse4/CasC [Pectobacterium odoriferum]|uniref:type I-E CRISPR-associated protein Cas7/Cse4/CasC n=1 Tax=Pectobacterium TaxID=122277 RepID=UPI000B7BF240|nr:MULTISPECIES: type I-E CRISPR-associated protein Cas7/Cse4/CasC [Pectobacterium]ASN87380.1 Type I-E CRISPR-associated protein Cas7/Cse4/CasC [Pectobacterium versatile]AVT57080.1 CRISPR-associated protein CasC/Cse4 [Pectobacterium versatile]MBD0845063.1 CRISPR-associated protein Cse4 [Pectobacterium carotovorum subsp. carotovorum]MBK4824334.1 CRISPR system Cascade subunit CasC [Pectobacterium carotovorum subsp. carotovorum]MBQ4763840.1 type I-E CRISPR-associated protein Cas7/Cse4/CasC [Pecto